MCTASTYKTKDFYMGRTFDYEFSYGEEIVVTPRKYVFDFRHTDKLTTHYAMIGMAFVADGYPLYYDAVNEKGLGMAGLNFVGNAVYEDAAVNVKTNEVQVAQFEFVPWVLGQCGSVTEARKKIAGMKLTGTPFSARLPAAQLHWMIASLWRPWRMVCMFMIILSESLLTIRRFLCSSLRLTIMREHRGDSRKIPLQER